VIVGTFEKLVGVSGKVRMIAPLPTGDSGVVPWIFVAVNLVKILEPHGKLNGLAINVAIGIVQEAAAIITELAPSQDVNSWRNVDPSLDRIKILYELTTEPPLYGAVHVIVTKVLSAPVIVVVGVAIVAGMSAAKTAISDEKSLKPISFLA
jgi:hypothetical protein